LACRGLAQSRRETTGKTPLLQLKGKRILAKVEFFNPGGSIKHRGVENQIKNGLRQGGKERN